MKDDDLEIGILGSSNLDDVEERKLSLREEAEFKRLAQEDPWEAVLYLVSINHRPKARRFQQELIQRYKEEIVRQLQGDFLMDGVLLGGPDESGRYIVSTGGGRYAVQLSIDPPPAPEELVPGREVWVHPEDKKILELRNTYSQDMDGVLLGGPDENGRYIVGIAGGRYAVQLLVDPPPSPGELSPGREVWIHPESKAILKLRDTYFQGEVVPVVQVIHTAETFARKDEVEGDANPKDATPRFSVDLGADAFPAGPRLLLKVKSHQDEIMVEAVPSLVQEKPEAGDLVRIVPSLGVALELVSRQQQDTLLFEVPDVAYEDIGGLDEEIARIRDAIDEPYLHPELFQQYDLQRPRGILLYGPPGCGKTMIAKAIANNLSKQIDASLPELEEKLRQYLALDSGNGTSKACTELERFLRARDIDPTQAAQELERVRFAREQGSKSYFRSIKGPELLSKWVGEGEANIRGLFASARKRASFTTPVVLFFDEIESMFSRRGSGISSDIQKTIVPQLLAEMDGLEETHHVIVIGATNRFDLVDPAVLRPGRLDFKIKISRPNRNREAPRAILKKYLTPDTPFPLEVDPADKEQCQAYAERLIERTLDILFHQKSRLTITELIGRQRAVQEMKREPRKIEKQVWEIISGAMLESIVSRAKRAAVKRAIDGGETGLTWPDLYQAIKLECQEGKDQYIHELYQGDPTEREQAYHDIEQFHVDVRLPPQNAEAAPVDPLALEERESASGEEIPDVEYEDIGGLDDQIAAIREAIEQPYLHPTLFQRYDLQRPGGILLHGPPGCGKTMIAKAIANNLSKQVEISRRQIKTAIELYLKIGNGEVGTEKTAEQLYCEWSAFAPRRSEGEFPESLPAAEQRQSLQIALEQFLSSQDIAPMQAAEELQEINLALEQGIHSYFINIKGPEILSKWVGESESTVRGIFARARDRATFYTPVVLFFDEIESLFSRRGSRSASDMQSTIVPQLLAEMDGIDEMRHVIVIGASNRFDLIDPAVLRPGRLDFKIEIPRPNQNRQAPRSILLRYLTPDLPFPSSLPCSQTLDSWPEDQTRMAETLGQRAMGALTLNECLTATMENLIKANGDFRAALFLTDWYASDMRLEAGRRRPVKELSLRAAGGFDEPEQRKTMVKVWLQKEGGIAWDAVRACTLIQKQGTSQNISPATIQEILERPQNFQTRRSLLSRQEEKAEGLRTVSAWPIQAPNDANMVLGALVTEYDAQKFTDEMREHIADVASALGIVIQARRNYADHLMERILDIVFHPQSHLVITEILAQQTGVQKKNPPRTMEKRVRDIVSGAMLESIVSRGKRIAVKREIAGGEAGIIWPDLYYAIERECEESKDQYSFELYSDDPYRLHAYQDAERVKVSVALPGENATPEERVSWLLKRPYAWRGAAS